MVVVVVVVEVVDGCDVVDDVDVGAVVAGAFGGRGRAMEGLANSSLMAVRSGYFLPWHLPRKSSVSTDQTMPPPSL